MIDCTAAWRRRSGQWSPRFGGVNLVWYEEPVPHTYHAELKQVTARAGPTDGLSGECLWIEGFCAFLLANGWWMSIMPDVKHDGGWAETLAIAPRRRGCSICWWRPQSGWPVSTAAYRHVVSAMSNFYDPRVRLGARPIGALSCSSRRSGSSRAICSCRRGLVWATA